LAIANAHRLHLGLGLPKAGDPAASLPLAALAEEGDAFKSLEDIPLGAAGADGAEASML